MIPADYGEAEAAALIARRIAIDAFQLGATALIAAILILFVILLCERKAT